MTYCSSWIRLNLCLRKRASVIKGTFVPALLSTSTMRKSLPDAFYVGVFSTSSISLICRNHGKIVSQVHYPHIQTRLSSAAMEISSTSGKCPGWKKKPSTFRSLLTGISWFWQMIFPKISLKIMRIKNAIPPWDGALLKNEQDVSFTGASGFICIEPSAKPMLIQFFQALRAEKIPVTLSELFALPILDKGNCVSQTVMISTPG